ncbi:hypothetical protein RHMOL_Rhmol01G0021800 [Rhododendron molle]|uniref:Uncharacterized protein n=1 Tax=Rhododendron molle TaxID=49168 RepID=A0ACC0PX64_RHOML|nr:hypothetical protein RHMOL_Rhmol01G0021800 [Rhododendron molle]
MIPLSSPAPSVIPLASSVISCCCDSRLDLSCDSGGFCVLALFQYYCIHLQKIEADGALDKARKDKKRHLEDILNLLLKKRKALGWIKTHLLRNAARALVVPDGGSRLRRPSAIVPFLSKINEAKFVIVFFFFVVMLIILSSTTYLVYIPEGDVPKDQYGFKMGYIKAILDYVKWYGVCYPYKRMTGAGECVRKKESFRDPAYKQILFHLFSEVLNSQIRLRKDLLPLFTYLVHSGISEVSLGDLLKSVLFDPSKILVVVLPQAGLEDEERRPEALVLVGCSGNCSNPEVVEALCSAVKFVIGAIVMLSEVIIVHQLFRHCIPTVL